jgi:hypothetical protein
LKSVVCSRPFLFEALQLLLQLRDFPVAQLGHLVEVVGALGFLHLQARGLDFLAQLARLLDGAFSFSQCELDAFRLLAGLGEFLAQHSSRRLLASSFSFARAVSSISSRSTRG